MFAMTRLSGIVRMRSWRWVALGIALAVFAAAVMVRSGGRPGAQRRSGMSSGIVAHRYADALRSSLVAMEARASGSAGTDGGTLRLPVASGHGTGTSGAAGPVRVSSNGTGPRRTGGRRAGPAPGSAAYIARDLQNMQDAMGRLTAPDGQLNNAEYQRELAAEIGPELVQKLMEQAASPTHLAANAQQLVPLSQGGSPFRHGHWNGVRGQTVNVSFLDRWGALLRGQIYAPLSGARHPDTEALLSPPYPGLVFVPGNTGGRGPYEWAAEDLAERGYVVLVFDPQGQGSSETLAPPCAEPSPGEKTKCGGLPAVPFPIPYEYGTDDAMDFFWSTPANQYRGSANQNGGGAAGAEGTDAQNPYWQLFDRSADPAPVTPGRPYRFALAGHSLGAAVSSYLGNIDSRVSAIVALDKLLTTKQPAAGTPWKPTVPALSLNSEYEVGPHPYNVGLFVAGPSELYPSAGPPTQGPDPAREINYAYKSWATAGADVMTLVPRASTHFEYWDVPFGPASRYGQALTSYYQTAWLDKYLKHDPSADARLAATSFHWLEPKGNGVWGPTPTLVRDDQLSFYFCSAWRYHALTGSLVQNDDPTGAGCVTPRRR